MATPPLAPCTSTLMPGREPGAREQRPIRGEVRRGQARGVGKAHLVGQRHEVLARDLDVLGERRPRAAPSLSIRNDRQPSGSSLRHAGAVAAGGDRIDDDPAADRGRPVGGIAAVAGRPRRRRRSPRIWGGVTGADDTPRSVQMSWWLRDAARTLTSAQPGLRLGRRQVTDGQIGEWVVAAHRRRVCRKHRLTVAWCSPCASTAVLEGRTAAGLLVRVLPAEDRRRRAPALRDDLAPPRARADVRLGDLRRRRIGAHAHRRAGHAHPPRARHRAGGASDLRRRDRRRAARHPRRAARRRHRQRPRAARRSARRRRARSSRPRAASRTAASFMEFITAGYDFCVGGACYPEKHPESASTDEDVRCAPNARPTPAPAT